MARIKHHEYDKNVGARLRALRMSLPMSQTRLGAYLNVTYQQIQKYESGRSGLTVGQLRKVCELLNVTPNRLLGFQDDSSTAKSESLSHWDRLIAVHGLRMEGLATKLALADNDSVTKLIDLVNALVKTENPDVALRAS